ncbi:AAA family ATPase [Stygiolobus caldivivus]|uniref:DNA double-strand break repair Rad50 ATPase n=1 Tax=Stygiolobus caldivivus TaxID=2824673 RepID=A0A8D5U531_9CREN|nr:AAA family ATPase [Stygiolobus caldivivus]BCU69230.1 hypothetical protein KN1_05270 [Stygiolobus caldivivus]
MIEIRKVKLENFLSHERSEVTFSPGINVIIGHNGAGKSSIIDAIYFSLFREPVRKISLEELIRKGAKDASVELLVEVDNRSYLISRNIKGGIVDTLSELVPNKYSKTIARGAKEVNEHVYKLLGANEDVFSSTLFIGQGKIEEVFDNLSEIMEKILKLERMNKLRETNGPIHSLIKEIEGELKVIEEKKKRQKELEHGIEESKKKVEEEEKALHEKTKEKEEIEIRIKEKKEEINSIEDKRNKLISLTNQKSRYENETSNIREKLKERPLLEKKRDDLQNYIKDEEPLNEKLKAISETLTLLDQINQSDKLIQKLREELSKKKSDLEEKKKLEEKERRYRELDMRKNELEEKEKQYISKTAELRRDKIALEEKERKLKEFKDIDTSELEDKIKKIKEELEEKRRQIEGINSRKGEIEGEIKQLLNIKQNLQTFNKSNKCPVCGRDLSEHDRTRIDIEIEQKVKELSAKKLELNKEYQNINVLIRQLEQLLDRTEKELKEALRHKAQLDALKSDIQHLQDEISDLEKEVSELTPLHEEFKKVSDELKILVDYHNRYLKVSSVSEEEVARLEDELQKEVVERDRRQENLKKILKDKGLPTDKKELIALGEEIENKLKEIKKKKDELSNIQSKLAILESEESRLLNLENELKEIERQIKELNFREEDYALAKQELDELQREYTNLTTEIGRLSGEITILKTNIEKNNQELNEIKKELEKEEKLINAKKKLEKLRDVLNEKNLQAFLKNNAKSSIENNLVSILSKFDLSYRALELNFDKAGSKGKNKVSSIIVFNDKGEEVSVNALSGGERTSIALALRLAIARSLMKGAGILILDEPTVNLDEYRKRELIDIIRSSLEIVNQIILVTHDEELMEAGDYVLKLEKRGGISKVEVVSNNQQAL